MYHERCPLPGRWARMEESPMQINGIMVDPARTLQPLRYYQQVVQFCAEWGLNTLLLHLTDDQGSALRLRSLPGAAVAGAWGPKEAGALSRYAERHGVELIPEVESFGHTRYITELPEYRHLRDDSGEPDAQGNLYSGINPCHPQTLELFSRIYREVNELFPGRYLHIGCDEVDFGHSPQVRKALETRPKWRLYADYVNELAGIAKGCGREVLFWGDHALKEPAILGALDKELICVDWYYWETDLPSYSRRLRTALDSGLRVICAPALAWSAWGLHSGTAVLDTTRVMAEAAREARSERVLGLINTIWCPGRLVPASLWHGIAASAMLVRDPSVSFETITAEFVARFYGARPHKGWQEFFAHLYAAALPLRELSWQAWHDAPSAKEALAHPGPADASWATGLRLAHELRREVKRHRASFDQLALVLQLRAHWDWRRERLRRLLEKRADAKRLRRGFAAIAGQDARVAERFLSIWRRFYIPAHPREALRWGLGLDQNLYASLCAAADYTGALARGEGLDDLHSVRTDEG